LRGHAVECIDVEHHATAALLVFQLLPAICDGLELAALFVSVSVSNDLAISTCVIFHTYSSAPAAMHI
jgi:hypothetical protein